MGQAASFALRRRTASGDELEDERAAWDRALSAVSPSEDTARGAARASAHTFVTVAPASHPGQPSVVYCQIRVPTALDADTDRIGYVWKVARQVTIGVVACTHGVGALARSPQETFGIGYDATTSQRCEPDQPCIAELRLTVSGSAPAASGGGLVTAAVIEPLLFQPIARTCAARCLGELAFDACGLTAMGVKHLIAALFPSTDSIATQRHDGPSTKATRDVTLPFLATLRICREGPGIDGVLLMELADALHEVVPRFPSVAAETIARDGTVPSLRVLRALHLDELYLGNDAPLIALRLTQPRQVVGDCAERHAERYFLKPAVVGVLSMKSPRRSTPASWVPFFDWLCGRGPSENGTRTPFRRSLHIAAAYDACETAEDRLRLGLCELRPIDGSSSLPHCMAMVGVSIRLPACDFAQSSFTDFASSRRSARLSSAMPPVVPLWTQLTYVTELDVSCSPTLGDAGLAQLLPIAATPAGTGTCCTVDAGDAQRARVRSHNGVRGGVAPRDSCAQRCARVVTMSPSRGRGSQSGRRGGPGTRWRGGATAAAREPCKQRIPGRQPLRDVAAGRLRRDLR
jgi:hypothetical protein